MVRAARAIASTMRAPRLADKIGLSALSRTGGLLEADVVDPSAQRHASAQIVIPPRGSLEVPPARCKPSVITRSLPAAQPSFTARTARLPWAVVTVNVAPTSFCSYLARYASPLPVSAKLRTAVAPGASE